MANMQEIYTGKVLKTGDIRNNLSPESAHTSNEGPQEEADAIIAKANQDAVKLRDEKLSGIDAEFERRITEKLVSTIRDLHIGIDSAANDMAAILTEALRDIIGDTSDPQTIAAALKTAISRYKVENIAKIRVSPANFSELELIRLGASISGVLDGIKIETDATLETGRCIIQMRDKQIEVSLESQIETFRKAVSRSAMVEVVKGAA